MKQLKTILIGFLVMSIWSCYSQKKIQNYDLSVPGAVFKIDTELNEISGLEYVDRSTLLAVQDELGKIFHLDPSTGEIKKELSFGGKGDYEGIAKVNESVFVLLSNGTLVQIIGDEIIERHKFKHHKDMEFEGLCYDKAKNRLLVACKENLKKGNKKEFFIYGFNLEKMSYRKKPIVEMKQDKVHKNFKPSGIAIHPSGSIYILSSVSKSLLVLSSEGEIITSTQLNSYVFHQPEGITFTDKGTLIIANEKHKSYPTLLIFKPQKK